MACVWRSEAHKMAGSATADNVSILENLQEDESFDIHSLAYTAVPYMIEKIAQKKSGQSPMQNIFCEDTAGMKLEMNVGPVTVTPGFARSLLLLLEVSISFLPTLANFICI